MVIFSLAFIFLPIHHFMLPDKEVDLEKSKIERPLGRIKVKARPKQENN